MLSVSFFPFKSKIVYFIAHLNCSGESETRKELAKSVNSKIFFAGEACNTNKNSGTVHGALETAYNVGKEIISMSV